MYSEVHEKKCDISVCFSLLTADPMRARGYKLYEWKLYVYAFGDEHDQTDVRIFQRRAAFDSGWSVYFR